MDIGNIRPVDLKRKRKLEKKFGLNEDEINIQAHQSGGKLTWIVHRVVPAGDETNESTLPSGLFETFKKRVARFREWTWKRHENHSFIIKICGDESLKSLKRKQDFWNGYCKQFWMVYD